MLAWREVQFKVQETNDNMKEKAIARRNRVNSIKGYSSTGFKGVYFDGRFPENPYRSVVTIYNKYTIKTHTIYLGSFPTAELASYERLKFISRLF